MALPPPVESPGQVTVALRPNFAPMFQCIGTLLGIRRRTTTEVVSGPEHGIRGERCQAELHFPGAAKAQGALKLGPQASMTNPLNQ